MSKLTVATSFNIELEFNIPEFHKRLFAWLIDMVLAIIYLIIAFRLLATFNDNPEKSNDFMSNNMWSIMMLILFPVSVYPLVCDILMNGQTIGKRIIGLRVINEDGGNASISQFVIRWLLRVSDFLMIIIILATISGGVSIITSLLPFFLLVITDIFSVIINKRAQRLGDMAAGTIVISTKTKSDLQETVFMETAETYVPLYPQVMRLSDRDLNVVKSVYNNASRKNNYILAERTANKIQAVLQINSSQDSLDFLETLLKDYNYLSTR
jgi:uncharacterized RDD family membrane protein YckC